MQGYIIIERSKVPVGILLYSIYRRTMSALSLPRAATSPEEPVLVHSKGDTNIYRHGELGIKVLMENPTEEQMLKFVHEQNVSRYLPPTCHKRQVIDVKGFKGNPAIHFEWVNGNTLTEWLQTAKRRPDINTTIRMRAATAIVETLADFHKAGVVYNNLSSDNIVLDTFEGSYIATFINLSTAIIHTSSNNNEGGLERDAAEIDLSALGQILHALFDPENIENYSSNDEKETTTEEETVNIRRKRNKRQAHVEGLPMCLNALISALSGRGGETSESYETAKDVLSDLHVIATNPQIFLKTPTLDDFTAHSRLKAPVDAFYGRQSEISMLYHAFNSVIMLDGQPMVVSILGSPGMGKTSLVNQIRKPLQQANGYLIRGKFDVRTRPDSVIFSALDDFFAGLIEERKENVQDIINSILHAVGPGCRVLMNSIPNLQRFMEGHLTDNSDGSIGNSASEHRWKYLLCKLITAVSSRKRPLAIFLDDLQVSHICLFVQHSGNL